MKVLIVKSRKASKYPAMISAALGRLGLEAFVSDWDPIALAAMIEKNELAPENTLVHARAAGKNANKVFRDLEAKGYRVINSAATLGLTSDKHAAQIFAAGHGMPATPGHLVRKQDSSSVKSLLLAEGALVAKPVWSQGGGSFCFRLFPSQSDEEISAILSSVPGEEILIQEFVPYKRLIRTFVIGYSCLRDASVFDEPSDDWKCSVCLNPSMRKYVPGKDSEKLFVLAEKTAKAFGAEISYIDFFETAECGFVLNELNTSCSLIIHEAVTGIPIHEKIAAFLASEANKREKLP